MGGRGGEGGATVCIVLLRKVTFKCMYDPSPQGDTRPDIMVH